jgi:hypothetical protein
MLLRLPRGSAAVRPSKPAVELTFDADRVLVY